MPVKLLHSIIIEIHPSGMTGIVSQCLTGSWLVDMVCVGFVGTYLTKLLITVLNAERKSLLKSLQ